MSAATWLLNELDRKGCSYEELHHADAYTAQEVAQHEHVSGDRVAKVVGVIADGRPVELVLPASRRVMLHRVGQILGAFDVRLATESELERFFPDCELGAIPAVRHWRGVDVIVDGHLSGAGNILILGGTHRDAIC